MEKTPAIALPEKKGPSLLGFCFWTALMGLLYVGGIGPVMKLTSNGLFMRHKAAGTCMIMIYYPLIFAYDKIPAIRGPLGWYADLWTKPTTPGKPLKTGNTDEGQS
jgi:hypothetical protein